MASSVNNGSSVSHHSASKIIITVQTFVILSLTYWLVEEYLNNQYLRQYVSDSFQANGLLFGILGLLLVVGPATGMFLKHRHGQSTVSLEIKTPRPTVGPTMSVAKSQESKKPDIDFHPAVAALKADMANRRSSFGSGVSTENEQPPMPPAPRPDAQKASVLEQLTANRPAPTTSPMLQQVRAPFPQPPPLPPRPQAQMGPRVDLPGVPPPQRPMLPMRPQETTGSSVLQPVKIQVQQTPTNITTIITGILPPKKKDPAGSEEKPASQ